MPEALLYKLNLRVAGPFTLGNRRTNFAERHARYLELTLEVCSDAPNCLREDAWPRPNAFPP